jgi:hypothetical protein
MRNTAACLMMIGREPPLSRTLERKISTILLYIIIVTSTSASTSAATAAEVEEEHDDHQRPHCGVSTQHAMGNATALSG